MHLDSSNLLYLLRGKNDSRASADVKIRVFFILFNKPRDEHDDENDERANHEMIDNSYGKRPLSSGLEYRSAWRPV